MARTEPFTDEEIKTSKLFRNKVTEYQKLTLKTYRVISKELGIGHTYFSSMMNGKVKITGQMLAKITAFVDEERAASIPFSPYDLNNVPQVDNESAKNDETDRDKEIAMLKETIKRQAETIEDLRYIIDSMKSMMQK